MPTAKSAINVGIAAAKSVYTDLGNQLISIVDNSKDLSDAMNRVNSLDTSDSRKQTLIKELKGYYGT